MISSIANIIRDQQSLPMMRSLKAPRPPNVNRVTGKVKCPFCDVRHIGCFCDLRHIGQLPRWREGDGMWKLLASLTVAAVMALAASSDFALGGDKVPKKTGNARCVQLSNGESMCLTCQDGPCDIKSGLANPVTTSAGSGIVRHSSASSPKPKVSANHALNDETKR
jgi:hypothetical protein